MAEQRDPHTQVDEDGVRVTGSGGVRPAVWLVVTVVLALAGALLFSSLRSPKSDLHVAPPQRGSARRLAPGGAKKKVARAPRPLPPARDGIPDGEDHAADTDRGPDADVDGAGAASAPQDVEEAMTDDQPRGIALFPPPGTDPLKRGIIVPESFALPDGYVRHYQVTDDGKPLRAVLMFHPDYQPVDDSGAAIEMPADRLVPPDMVPEGLDIEYLDDPESVVPFAEEHDQGDTEPES